MEPTTSKSFPLVGMLEDQSLPELLIKAFQNKTTGMLYLATGQIKSWIYLENGYPAGTHIPDSEKYLGSVMLELGYIDERSLSESLTQMSKQDAKQGQILIEMGKITKQQLDHALQIQLYQKLCELFSLQKGSFGFAEGEGMPSKTHPIPIHPYRLIHNGIKLCYPSENIDALLKTTFDNQLCGISSSFFESKAPFNLSAEEKADLEALRQYKSASDFIQSASSGSLKAKVLLLSLYYCDFIETIEFMPIESQTEIQPEETTEPAVQQPGPYTLSIGELQQLLKDKIAQIKNGTYLDLLDLPDIFDDQQLQNNFKKLADQLNPQQEAAKADQELSQVMSFVMNKITKAYETLNNPFQRKPYLEQLSGQQEQPTQIDPIEAGVAYEKAKVYLQRNQPTQALEMLKMAVKYNPEKLEYKARLLWVEYICASEPKQKLLLQTQKELEKILYNAPNNFYANRCLALVFQAQKKQSEYEKYLIKANNIRPTDIETAREFRLLMLRKKKKK
jgi:tetratricopeptide (TPR) repeat protein